MEVAALINGYTKLNRRRTPELLAPDTFSLLHDREAERMLADWRDLAARAARLKAALPAEARPAFLQLVLHPIEACANHNELLITAGRNRLYATQGRASTNDLAQKARDLFARDGALTRRWDALLDGKWRHLMDQVHLGYTIWQQPITNIMPAVSEVHVPAAGRLAIAVEGDPAARPGDYPVNAVAKLPVLHAWAAARTRWIDVFNRGAQPVRFRVEATEAWLRVTPAAGEVGPDTRLEVGADWAAVPSGTHRARLTIRSEDGVALAVDVPVEKPTEPAAGFVEIDRSLAIEAPHADRVVPGRWLTWQALPGFGRTVGAMTLFPVTAPATEPGPDSARLEYDVHLTTTGEVRVELHCAPSLDFLPGEGLRIAVSFDEAPPQLVRLGTNDSPAVWEKAVADSVRRVATTHRIERPGAHVLKVWAVTPGVVVERIIIDAGGAKPTYLGPPESPRLRAP